MATPEYAPRRRVLAALGLGASGALAGCLSDVRDATTGYLQLKGISVAWRHDGRLWDDEILFATSDGATEFRCRVAEEYASIVDRPDERRVDADLEQRLERDFAGVTDVTGVCWSEPDGHTCRNPRASRATFNRVQFGDRAEVVFRSPGAEVVDIHERGQGDPAEWDTRVERFEFEALHEDDGVPLDGRQGPR